MGVYNSEKKDIRYFAEYHGMPASGQRRYPDCFRSAEVIGLGGDDVGDALYRPSGGCTGGGFLRIEGEDREGEYRMEKERKTETGPAMDRNAEGMCCHRTKERSDKEYRDLLNRLNRIEGQVRGIKGMVEKNAYCPDILIQVAAVNAALNSFNKVLLANHIRTCVTRDIQAGKEETIDELVMTLQKLMK